MQKSLPNFAFIDQQNLYFGIKQEGWHVDYKKFRRYLKEKYSVEKAYIFMGYLPTNQKFYNFLQTAGFVLVFKPILDIKDKIKGNCDAELVLQTMIDFENYDKAVIVTGDGDFYCLVKHLDDHRKLQKVLAPSPRSCSALLTQVAKKNINYVSDLKTKIEYKKEPHKDGTL